MMRRFLAPILAMVLAGALPLAAQQGQCQGPRHAQGKGMRQGNGQGHRHGQQGVCQRCEDCQCMKGKGQAEGTQAAPAPEKK